MKPKMSLNQHSTNCHSLNRRVTLYTFYIRLLGMRQTKTYYLMNKRFHLVSNFYLSTYSFTTKYPVNFDDELKIWDVRYGNMT